MAGRKRKALTQEDVCLVTLAGSARLPVAQILAHARPGARTLGVESKRLLAHKIKYAEFNASTVYGQVAETLTIGHGNETLDISHCNPAAFLRKASEVSAQFGVFLQRCLGGNPGHIVLYLDEVTPGNVHRPDHGRKYQAVYWTIKELPGWFRRRADIGWFPVAYITAQSLEDSSISPSELVKWVLKTFWPADIRQLNLEDVGMRLLVDSVPVHTIFVFGFLLADCKAHAEAVCNNGASSKKPCPCCMNVLGRTDRASLVGDAYFMHVTDPDMGKAVQFTKDTFNAMADVLRTAATDGTEKHRFDALQMQTGLKYDEHGLIWDPHFREIASCPDSLFWDPQHIFLASGGTAQFQCNEFIRNLLKHNITLADLDSFVATVHFPRGHTNLPRIFSQNGIEKGRGNT